MASLMTAAAAVVYLGLASSSLMSAQCQDSTDQVKQELFEREVVWIQLYNGRNFTGLCNELYTEDCVLYLPNHTIARGREECAHGWESMHEEDYQYASEETPIIGEVIVTSSGYVIEHSMVGDSVDQYVKYMVIWKRIGGKLYLYHDITNPNTPYREPTLLEEITDRRNELTYYFDTGDFQSACKMFTPDCWIAPPGAPPVFGRDGCERLTVKVAASGMARIVEIPEQHEVYDIGDGYVLFHGAWIEYDATGGELDRGKDMKIWKRQEDGQYYIHFNMWNSDIHF